MAAYRAGIKKVIIPADNTSDLAEIDEVVKKSVEFCPVEKVDQVLEMALLHLPAPKESFSEESENSELHLQSKPSSHNATAPASIPQ